MRFGLTYDEQYEEYMRVKSTWRETFAWWPVRVEDGTWVWLEPVKVRGETGFKRYAVIEEAE